MRAMDLEQHYCAHNYTPLDVEVASGDGAWLTDSDGKRYLDMMSAYSAVSHGHGHPRIIKALTDQLGRVAVTSRAFYTDKLGPFLEKLCAVSGFEAALPMNTGAEAVETAIKAARRWGYAVKSISSDQAEIIVGTNNFHGRTTTIVSFSTDDEYKRQFGPFSGGFVSANYGDIHAFEAAITPDTCAIMIEPIQGEAGIVAPPDGFLTKLRALCDKHNVLLILDEIQSGLGRTGKMFAFQHEDMRPDGLILGKALGGGVLPVSAFLADKAVMDLFGPGSHGSTFGGNPLAAAVAMEALAVLEEEDLIGRSAELGAMMKSRIERMKSPLIRQVRGKGLWLGVEFWPEKAQAKDVVLRLKDRMILAKETHATTLRLAPPLVIDKADLEWALTQFESVLQEVERGSYRDAECHAAE
ncbi:MAG: ornithine--oxo-acid transaminase [Pseudomonadota bacterium]